MFHCAALGLYTIGWYDRHFKTYVSTCYTTSRSTGQPAKKKGSEMMGPTTKWKYHDRRW